MDTSAQTSAQATVSEAPEPPSTPKSHLTRDDRIKINTLRSVGWTYEAIAAYMNCSQRQMQYTVSESKVTLTKRAERSIVVCQQDVNTIVDFVTSTKTGRQMAWSRIPIALSMTYITTRQIFGILRRAGFSRYVARKKPPISEINRQKRLA